jgi:hypothetical protein
MLSPLPKSEIGDKHPREFGTAILSGHAAETAVVACAEASPWDKRARESRCND